MRDYLKKNIFPAPEAAMSSISPISSSGYELRYDATRPGGIALSKAETGNASDTVSISDTGRQVASQAAAMRDEAARQMDAADRYQTALDFGRDFAAYMDGNINLVDEYGHKRASAELEAASYRQSRAFTTVSAQGTVIGISYLAAEGGHLQDAIPEVYPAQITRKDGFQFNITLEDDVRINDLEDGGLSIYYASSGITRTFDAEGRESVAQGEKNALGTGADDIIINRASKRVDAGDGNDIIINLADGAEILGGEGNDSIFLPAADTRGVTIDGGTGNDRIVGQHLSNATVIMGDGDDALTATSLNRAAITSSGDDVIKTARLINSSLVSSNGAFNSEIANIYESSVAIDQVKNGFSSDSIRGSKVRFGEGDLTLSSKGITNSELLFGDGNLTILSSGGIDYSILTHDRGSNTITGGSITDSTLTLGSGGNTFDTHGISGSTLNLGGGGNTITGGIGKSTLNVEGGGNTITGSGGIYRSKLNIAGGGNTITGRGGIGDSTLNFKGGGNTIAGVFYDSTLNFDETISPSSATHKAQENTSGSNFNKIISNGFNQSTLYSKSENLELSIGSTYKSTIHVENGTAKINIDSTMSTNIETGNGNDDVAIRSLFSSRLNTGGGNDNISIDMAMLSHINAGQGDNTIRIKDASHSSIAAGNGNNTIRIGRAADSTLNVGSGNNALLTEAAKELAGPHLSDPTADLDDTLMDILFRNEGAARPTPAAEGAEAGSLPDSTASADGQEDTQADTAAPLSDTDFARRLMQAATAAYARGQRFLGRDGGMPSSANLF